jgi:DNA-binding CsgD family transcriptional regulator
MNVLVVTSRESEVLACLAEGLSSADTAARLGISPVTVRRHVSRASRRLGVSGRAGLRDVLVEERRHGRRPRRAPAQQADPGGDALTAREREILRLVAEGHPTDAIAAALVISPSTVRNHVARILVKLGARNRTQAVARAVRRGYLD